MFSAPPSMSAIVVEGGKGPAGALRLATIARPSPGQGEILIRVRAAGVNRSDILQREGLYVPPPGVCPTLGLEVAGEVAGVGEGVTRWRVGDRAVALLGGGGYAEFVALDARHAAPIPGGLDFIQAAGIPETVITVFANVFESGGLRAGQTLLVHGATSGIGVTTIAMAKWAGARVIATARGPAKAAQALVLGADIAVDATHEDFVEVAKAQGGVDLVLDMVGGGYAQRDIESLKPGGRLVMIATQAGPLAELNLLMIMLKRLTLTGSTLRSRPADEKARLTAAVESTVWPWIEAGLAASVIDQVFPLSEASMAHARMEQGLHVGKLILTP
jgi:NADPH2:quinone reductase